MRSGVLNRPSGGSGGDMRVLSTLPGTLEKGGPSFILEFTTIVQGNPGHDKAPSYSVYNSPSTIRNSAKLNIYGKLRSRRIQRRRLQRDWRRTHRGRWVLPKNHYSALIRIINAFYFWLCLHWPFFLFTKGFIFNSGPFPVGFGVFLR